MSAQPAHQRPHTEPVALHHRAMDNLQYIRDTMERSASFTAVSGWAGVAMGVIALLAAWIASQASTPLSWLLIWVGAATVAGAVALAAMHRKAQKVGTSLWNGAGRKFVWSFAPPIFVGALLTVALYQAGVISLIPGTWLLLYGVAVVGGGQFSVRVVPLTGAVFIAVGVATLFTPPTWGDAMLAMGFGAVHIGSGLIIARRHGG